MKFRIEQFRAAEEKPARAASVVADCMETAVFALCMGPKVDRDITRIVIEELAE